MGMIIGLTGMFWFHISLVLLIISLIKKGKKKKHLIGLGISFIMFIVGLALTPTPETPTSEENSFNNVDTVDVDQDQEDDETTDIENDFEKEVESIVVDSFMKSSEGATLVHKDSKDAILNLLKEHESNPENYQYILDKIEETYLNYISYEIENNFKENDVNEYILALLNLEFLVENDLGINSINSAFEIITDLNEVAGSIVKLEKVEKPDTTNLNMDLNVAELTQLDCYVQYRIENNNSLFGLNQYSNYYFVSNYTKDVFGDIVPTQSGEAVVLPLSDNISKGVNSLQVVPDGTITLTSEGFKTEYPLYREVSDTYIANYNKQLNYEDAIRNLKELRESHDILINRLKEIVNS